MRGVPRERCAMRRAPPVIDPHVEDRGRALHDPFQILDAVELQPLHDAEAVAQRAR